MKILAINGSPRGKSGMTWWVLDRFVQGMQQAGGDTDIVHLAGKQIHHCTGELSCWFRTPGQCIHRDDMDGILALMQSADALILATPVYVDGMTGILKDCIDRMVPLVDPHIEMQEGHQRHPSAGTLPKLIALVSVCGFFELDNFEPLVAHVKAICRNMKATYAGAILRPAAPALPFTSMLHPFKTRAVTKAIRQSGDEFVRSGKISEETQSAVAADILSKESYQKQANRYFEKLLKRKQDPSLDPRPQPSS